MQIDHINDNGLDNRRSNLRICSQSQNLMNCRKPKTLFSSKYKGVSWVQKHKRWKVSIAFKGKRKYIGHFLSEIDAAKAYNKAAEKYFGEFARLNKF